MAAAHFHAACRGAHQCHGPGCSPISCMGEVPAPGVLNIHHVGIGDVHSVCACRPVNAACVLHCLHPNTRMPLKLHGTLQCYGHIRTGFCEFLFLLTAKTETLSCSFQSRPSQLSSTKICPVCRKREAAEYNLFAVCRKALHMHAIASMALLRSRKGQCHELCMHNATDCFG